MQPEATLFVLVTCSRDVTRRDMAIAVTRNLAALTEEMGQSDRLVIFDNASTYLEHLEFAPKNAIICRSAENVGYWSAINWVLEHVGELTDFECRYVYVIESDLEHSALRPLALCERFLADHAEASSVRTQEFSVAARWRYNKSLKWLPFHVVRSQVSLRNAVNNERASFTKVPAYKGIYLSNLHAKLPALQRLDTLKKVFASLAAMEGFTEFNFFKEMLAQHPMIGVFDGGLFHSLTTWDDRASTVSGSYTSPESLAKLGYQATRTAKISAVQGEVLVTRSGVGH